MTLETQVIPVAIQGGLAEQVEALVAPGGAWLTLVNMGYDKAGILRRRHGFEALTTDTRQGGDLPEPRSLHAAGGRLVATVGRTAPELLSHTDDGWQRHDDAPCATVRRAPVQRSGAVNVGNMQTSVVTIGDAAYVTHSWTYDDSLFIKTIQRTAAGDVVIHEARIAWAAGIHAAVSVGVSGVSGVVLFFYSGVSSDAGKLFVRQYDPVSGGYGDRATCVESGLRVFDACTEGADSAMVTLTGGTYVTVQRWAPGSPPTMLDSDVDTVDFVDHITQLAVAVDGDSVFVAVGCFYIGSGLTYSVTLMRWIAATLNSAHPDGNGQWIAGGAGSLYAVTVGCDPVQKGGWVAWWSLREEDAADNVAMAPFDPLGEVDIFAGFPRTFWARIYSRPVYAAGRLYLLLADHISTCRAYALVRMEETLAEPPAPLYCGAVALDEAPGVTSAERLVENKAWPHPAFSPLDDGRFSLPLRVPTIGNQRSRALYGLDEAVFDFTFEQAPLALPGVEAQGALCLGGVLPAWFDGQAVVEQGFLRPPIVSDGSAEVVGGGEIGGSDDPVSAYLYCFIYEWIDGRGNWHRSEPSAPITVEVTAAETDATINITVGCLGLTARGDGADVERSYVRIAVYRTLANTPEVFYRVDDPALGTYVNDRAAAVVEVSDTLSDADLLAAGHGTLYTQGGVLENTLAPPLHAVAVWKNRLWGASGDNPRQVVFSKRFLRTEAPGFNPVLLNVGLDDAEEDITGLAPLGGSLLIFTRTRTYYLTGEPPNDTGRDNQLIGPELLSTTIGCTDPRSIVSFPGGVLFLAEAGFHVVATPQSPPAFVGAPVRDTTRAHPICRGVIYDAVRARVIWSLESTTSDQTLVVFDYLHNAWSHWSLPGAPRAMALVGGLHHVALEDVVWRESGVEDDGRFISFFVRAPWLRFAGLLGWQRTRRVLLRIERDGELTLLVRLRHDDRDGNTGSQVQEFDLSTGTAMSSLDDRRFGLEMHVNNQKNASLQIELAGLEAGDCESFALYGLSVEAGLKKGRSKLPGENRR